MLGTVFPGDGVATIANVVANCAMAGCLPEHVSVVIAAVECIAERAFKYSYDWQTDSKPGESTRYDDPDRNAPSERRMFVAPVLSDCNYLACSR